MKKGIFWCKNYLSEGPELIVVSVTCDKNGNPAEYVRFSSKSGTNFNHKCEWEWLDGSITGRKPFDYYPRGRVEIKNGKATVYFNPVLNTELIVNMITSEFDLDKDEISVRFVNDGSDHYRFSCENS